MCCGDNSAQVIHFYIRVNLRSSVDKKSLCSLHLCGINKKTGTRDIPDAGF